VDKDHKADLPILGGHKAKSSGARRRPKGRTAPLCGTTVMNGVVMASDVKQLPDEDPLHEGAVHGLRPMLLTTPVAANFVHFC